MTSERDAESGVVEEKLRALGIELPEAIPFPSANRTGCVRSGEMLFVSGHSARGIVVPSNVRLFGKLGAELTVEDGRLAARYAILKLLASVKAEIGDLDRVRRVVRLLGMVNAAPDFEDHPAVIDGASDLLHTIFGAAGIHARSAVGMSSLPHGSAVEIAAEFTVDPEA